MDHHLTSFAAEWVAAWNAHDLERVLSHYTEDCEFLSPVAAARVPGSGGRLVGKAALAGYWGPALRDLPDLHFRLECVLATVSGCTLLYRNQRDQTVAETMLFAPDGRVRQGIAAYAG